MSGQYTQYLVDKLWKDLMANPPSTLESMIAYKKREAEIAARVKNLMFDVPRLSRRQREFLVTDLGRIQRLLVEPSI